MQYANSSPSKLNPNRLSDLLLLPATASWACDCLPKAPCGEGHYAKANFIGEVVSWNAFPSGWDLSKFLDDLASVRAYGVRVLESFRGKQAVGDFVHLKTGVEGVDCGYRFKIGARYFIDAYMKEGMLATNICTLTGPIEKREVEVRTLRAAAKESVSPTSLVCWSKKLNSHTTAAIHLFPQ